MSLTSVYFFLSRCLLVVSAPLFYAILCVAIGAYLHSVIGIGIGIIVLLLLSCRPLYDAVERKMFSRYLKELSSGKKYDYAVIMGGFSRFDWDRKRIEFNDRADRLIEGVLFYKRGVVKRLLITGDGSISQLHPAKGSERVEGNPEVMLRFLEDLGVARKDVYMELYARNTWENALGVRKILEENHQPNSSLLMVTSAYHVRRALASFARVGLVPDYYAVDLVKDFVQPPLYWLPDLEVSGKWQELVHQIVGTWLISIKQKL